MIEIKDLLSKWSHLLVSEGAKKNALLLVLKEVLDLDIDSNAVTIKNGTVYLDIKPIYRSQILIKREEIFSKLKERLGNKTPNDIR